MHNHILPSHHSQIHPRRMHNMTTNAAETDPRLQEFLQPLRFDLPTLHQLSRAFESTFVELAANDFNQFLPTPISESILRPVSKNGQGRYVRCALLFPPLSFLGEDMEY